MKRSLAIALVLVGTSAAFAQQVPLRANITPGLTWKFDYTQDTDSQNTATMNGQSQSFNTKTKMHRTGVAEVVSAENGVPSAIKFTFDQNCTATNEMNGQTQSQPLPFSGQSVTIKRNPDGTVTSDAQGGDPSAAADLYSMIDRDVVLMPNKPVSVGDEWSAEPKAAGRVLQLVGQDTGGMTLKLLSVKDVNGRPTAEVKVSFAVMKAQQNLNGKVIAQGVDLVDLATGHVVKSDLKGTVEMQGQNQMQGQDGNPTTVDYKANGNVTITGVAAIAGGGAAPAPMPTPAPAPSPFPTPAPVGPGANPLGASPFVGSFSDGKLKVDLALKPTGGFEGTFTLNGNTYSATAAAKDANSIAGSFTAAGQQYPFTATATGTGMTLTSGSTTYQLQKAAANPLDGGGPTNPLAR